MTGKKKKDSNNFFLKPQKYSSPNLRFFLCAQGFEKNSCVY